MHKEWSIAGHGVCSYPIQTCTFCDILGYKLCEVYSRAVAIVTTQETTGV